MEEKKFDINTVIGFVLIFALMIAMFYFNQPSPEELEAEKAKQEQVEAENETNEVQKIVEQKSAAINLKDSTTVVNYKSNVGAFSYTKISDEITELQNEVLYLKIANKGGQIVEAKMKNFVNYDSVPVYLSLIHI